MRRLSKLPNLQDLYHRYKHCVVRIETVSPEGDIRNGTGFTVGNGAHRYGCPCSGLRAEQRLCLQPIEAVYCTQSTSPPGFEGGPRCD